MEYFDGKNTKMTKYDMKYEKICFSLKNEI